jgi:small subunit ribosomal protein S16
MKTKLKLVKMGLKNHPVWHIVVQPDKKKLAGRYIERVGYWMPRRCKTVHRGIILNRHKIRYWMSIGA